MPRLSTGSPGMFLIEADTGLQALFIDLFSQEGFAVLVAASLQDAFQRVDEWSFELDLVDLFLGRSTHPLTKARHLCQRVAQSSLGLLMTHPLSPEEAKRLGWVCGCRCRLANAFTVHLMGSASVTFIAQMGHGECPGSFLTICWDCWERPTRKKLDRTAKPPRLGRGDPVKHLITHGCAICGEPTQDALCGNRLLVGSDVSRLPTEQAPAVSWRCRSHQRYQMRQASAVRASELGDLIYTLTCGHEVLGVFRGNWVYTPARVKRGILTRQIRLDQPQRCYRCGDLERESTASYEP